MNAITYQIFWDLHEELETTHQVHIDDNLANFLTTVAEEVGDSLDEVRSQTDPPVE